MSEQSSIFDAGTAPTVTELVGEGKKFKTVEDLARGKQEADSFIEKLTTENKALREALENEGNPDEVLKRINALLEAKGSGTTTKPEGNQPAPKSLSEKEVLDILSRRETEQKLTNNFNSFKGVVTKAFGEKTDEVINTRLGDLGMEQEVFKELAARNPQAALRILGLKEGGVPGSLESGSVNTESYFGASGKGNGETQNFAYFQKLRRELGNGYYEPHIQKQVFEARKKLGDAFWKG